MTGNSLHMQWPLTSQSMAVSLKENNWFFRYGSSSTPFATSFKEPASRDHRFIDVVCVYKIKNVNMYFGEEKSRNEYDTQCPKMSKYTINVFAKTLCEPYAAVRCPSINEHFE
jgi:hypothetical protein